MYVHLPIYTYTYIYIYKYTKRRPTKTSAPASWASEGGSRSVEAGEVQGAKHYSNYSITNYIMILL